VYEGKEKGKEDEGEFWSLHSCKGLGEIEDLTGFHLKRENTLDGVDDSVAGTGGRANLFSLNIKSAIVTNGESDDVSAERPCVPRLEGNESVIDDVVLEHLLNGFSRVELLENVISWGEDGEERGHVH
jgi:hypothetical protein